MGFIIFLLIFGAVVLFLFIVLGVLGLFFGGKDPYEEELNRLDFEDRLIENRGGDTFIDARSIHEHKHLHL